MPNFASLKQRISSKGRCCCRRTEKTPLCPLFDTLQVLIDSIYGTSTQLKHQSNERENIFQKMISFRIRRLTKIKCLTLTKNKEKKLIHEELTVFNLHLKICKWLNFAFLKIGARDLLRSSYSNEHVLSRRAFSFFSTHLLNAFMLA